MRLYRERYEHIDKTTRYRERGWTTPSCQALRNGSATPTRATGNELFTSSTPFGYNLAPGRAEDGAMIEFALGLGAAVFVHRWIRSAGPALGIPAVTVTALAAFL